MRATARPCAGVGAEGDRWLHDGPDIPTAGKGCRVVRDQNGLDIDKAGGSERGGSRVSPRQAVSPPCEISILYALLQ